MPYPTKMVTALTGVSPSQLRRLRHKGVINPTYSGGHGYLYTYDDVLVLRIFAKLRPYISAQKIDKAFHSFHKLISTQDHSTLSSHRFATDGTTIYTDVPDAALDLVRRPGQCTVFTFDEMTEEFVNWKGETVPNLLHPRDHLDIQEDRLSGWPTISGTRIPFDTIAALAHHDDMDIDDIRYYYPQVSAEAVRDAIDFDRDIRRIAA